MSGKFTITFSASAVSDLDDLPRHYRVERVPETGERLVAEIVSQVERLADYHESGGIVPEFNLAYLREIIYPPFRIIYRFNKKKVHVIRVWRSERTLTLQ
jgi:plasmid stabilization system protein ParE